jgi:hypothetical protein
MRPKYTVAWSGNHVSNELATKAMGLAARERGQPGLQRPSRRGLGGSHPGNSVNADRTGQRTSSPIYVWHPLHPTKATGSEHQKSGSSNLNFFRDGRQ